MLRKIDLMYWNFGYGKGYCHECKHFRKECWNKKADKNIVGYDEQGKEIVERKSFLACGLIDKDFPNDVIPGQMEIDGLPTS